MSTEPSPSPDSPSGLPRPEPAPAIPEREISLEEWIAAGQACCGQADAGAD